MPTLYDIFKKAAFRFTRTKALILTIIIKNHIKMREMRSEQERSRLKLTNQNIIDMTSHLKIDRFLILHSLWTVHVALIK